jgi:Carboxypeptidase regulatory-like domain
VHTGLHGRAARIGALLLASVLSGGTSAGGQERPVIAQPRTGTARLRGRVVATDSAAPIRRAIVRLVSPRDGSWVATTDNDGRYEFPDLPAGRFMVTATKAGFVTTGGGQATESGPGRIIELLAGQVLDNIDIRLSRGGVITGRISDELGDPMIDVYVQAFRTDYMQGIRRLSEFRTVQSNDIGQFRFYGLPPGRYYIAGILRPTDAIASREQTEVVRGGRGFAPTFFPGTTIAGDARAVNVAAGEETSGIDLALIDARLARISGSIVNSRGRPASDYVVMLNPARADRPAPSGVFVNALTDADGRFKLVNVAPGEYRLDVRPRAELEAISLTGRIGQGQGNDAGEFASVVIGVAGDDIESLVVTTSSGFHVSGQMVFNGASTSPDVMKGIRVSAFDVGAGVGVSAVLLSARTTVRPDASFDVRGVLGGRILRVEGLPAGWALDKVLVGGSDTTDKGFDIATDVAGVEVIVTAHPARLAGMVADSEDNPVRDCSGSVLSLWKSRKRVIIRRSY